MKPAWEPIVLARKPTSGTVAANVLAYGTGALNIDASRIGTTDDLNGGGYSGERRDATGASAYAIKRGGLGEFVQPAGRWPANVVLDAAQAAALDAQSGERRSAGDYPSAAQSDGELFGRRMQGQLYADQGGASRFFKTVDDVTPRFMYTAKAGSDERPNVDGVAHPTVKSLDLMRWLVKLVTPKGGTILEPFAGSGTTVEAAVLEGFRCIAIERETDYLPLIMQRVSKPHAVGLDFGDWEDAS